MNRLTMLVHGESGHGKSWLGDSAPGPRLLIDVEGRHAYTPSRKIMWDPRTPLPAAFEDGSPIDTETTIVVNVRDYPTFELVYAQLASGNHYFQSVIIDSLSRLQKRAKDSINPGQFEQQHWGELLRKIEQTVNNYVDLRTHPTNPLTALVIISGSHMKDGRQRPLLEGGMSNLLAYAFDLVGFLQFELNMATGEGVRKLAIQPYGLFVAKDNTDILSDYYGMFVEIPHKSSGRKLVQELLIVLNNPQGATAE